MTARQATKTNLMQATNLMSLTRQYLVYVRADTLDQAAEEALHLTYWFLTRALQEHRSQGKNGDYEAFAVGVLALLQQYRHVYTTVDTSVQEFG